MCVLQGQTHRRRERTVPCWVGEQLSSSVQCVCVCVCVCERERERERENHNNDNLYIALFSDPTQTHSVLQKLLVKEATFLGLILTQS